MQTTTSPSGDRIFLDTLRGLTQQTSINRTMEEICQKISNVFQPRHLALLLMESATGEMLFSVVIGEKEALVSGKRLRKGRGIAGWVAEQGKPLLITDTATDTLAQNFQTAKTKGAKSILAVPVRNDNLVYAVIELIDQKSGAPFRKEDQYTLEIFAEVMGIALDRAYYYQAMRRMAETDHLTGLPNKRIFNRQLERSIETCKRYGTPASVITVHIEKLREINDEHDITTGDKIIKLVAEVMNKDLRKVDLGCRIKADLYALLLPNTGASQAKEVETRIQTKIRQRAVLEQLPNFSVTIKTYSGTQEDMTALLEIFTPEKAEMEGFRKFRKVAANITQLIGEEKLAMERRQYYRKTVQLTGRYENPERGSSGEVLLDSLSLNGAGFTTVTGHGLEKNNLIRLEFQLDDSRRTTINRVAKIRYLKERYVGCTFIDTKSYDSDLGFYLMR